MRNLVIALAIASTSCAGAEVPSVEKVSDALDTRARVCSVAVALGREDVVEMCEKSAPYAEIAAQFNACRASE